MKIFEFLTAFMSVLENSTLELSLSWKNRPQVNFCIPAYYLSYLTCCMELLKCTSKALYFYVKRLYNMLTHALQYLSAWNNYKFAIDHIVLVPKYRMKAQEIAKSEGLLDGKKKKDKLKTKVHAIVASVSLFGSFLE